MTTDLLTSWLCYVKLHRLAKERVAGRLDGELALERYKTFPQKWESVLISELTKVGAADDADFAAAAKSLMELVDETGARAMALLLRHRQRSIKRQPGAMRSPQ